MPKGNGKGLVLFDIDGVLADFSAHMRAWKEARGMQEDEQRKYYSPNDTEWAKLHDRFAEHGFFLSTPVLDDTLEVMHALATRGYATGCFTARQSFTGNPTTEQLIHEHTRDWLKRAQIPHPDNLHFCGRTFKCDLIVGLGAIAMVEDHLETAEDIAKLNGHHGAPILSFLLDREWNREREYPHRIYDIREMLEHLP